MERLPSQDYSLGSVQNNVSTSSVQNIATKQVLGKGVCRPEYMCTTCENHYVLIYKHSVRPNIYLNEILLRCRFTPQSSSCRCADRIGAASSGSTIVMICSVRFVAVWLVLYSESKCGGLFVLAY